MKVKQINTGVFIDKKEVIAIELHNDKGSFVKIFNYGTIIHKFVVDGHDIVLGFDTFEEYLQPSYLENYPYFGAIIGRYANRIKEGRFNLDGVDYQLPLNAGDNCLHGGKSGFDRKVWDIIEVGGHGQAKITFQYFSLDGEENFPGDLAIQLTFELTNNDELILTYQADTDEATPINLTHHSYFNLSANGGQVVNHVHQMNASHYLEQDSEYCVTGKLVSVENTIHDFRQPRAIGSNWNAVDGYDQTYVLDKAYGTLTLASKTSETNTGLSLLVYTTEPVAHFYTAKYLTVKNGKGGKDYKTFDGFCVETQHHPNAVNIPHLPSTILRPEEVYTQTTIYKVSKV